MELTAPFMDLLAEFRPIFAERRYMTCWLVLWAGAILSVGYLNLVVVT
jgi:hypothetical protein